MKATELRIGNWVEWSGNAHSVVIVGEGFVQFRKKNLEKLSKNEGEIKPIPLTEEWLVKFGYAVRKSLGFEAYEINDIYTVYYNTTATPNGFEMCFGDFEIEIKWVHKLQNLHFALTGEELNQNKEDESK